MVVASGYYLPMTVYPVFFLLFFYMQQAIVLSALHISEIMLFPFITHMSSFFFLQVHFVLKELVRKSVAETEVRNLN
jgi:hypothetical protein